MVTTEVYVAQVINLRFACGTRVLFGEIDGSLQQRSSDDVQRVTVMTTE